MNETGVSVPDLTNTGSLQEAAANAKHCPKCKLIVDETDNYCRYCGRSLKPGRGFLNSHTGIILLMLVAGPFALPVVWMSQRISLVSKIIYSILMAIIGYYLIISCIQIYRLTFEMMQSMTTIGF